MKVWGVSEADIRAAVSEASLAVWNDYQSAGGLHINGIRKDGRGLLVRLAVDPLQPRNEAGELPWQKRGHNGRRLPYVTWEGHREFMRILFRDHPEAKVKSAIATYDGRKEFWRKHPATKGDWPASPYYGVRR
jgi:hypothetical protein